MITYFWGVAEIGNENASVLTFPTDFMTNALRVLRASATGYQTVINMSAEGRQLVRERGKETEWFTVHTLLTPPLTSLLVVQLINATTCTAGLGFV